MKPQFLPAFFALLSAIAVAVVSSAAEPGGAAPSAAAGAPVPIPPELARAAAKYGLDLEGVPVFTDPRHSLALSDLDNRRGVRLDSTTTVLLQCGGGAYWLVSEGDRPSPTTLAGPFKGDGIGKFRLAGVLRDMLIGPDGYDDVMGTIASLLSCDDPALVRLGLETIPAAMQAELQDVEAYLHYPERCLPDRRADFEKMGLAKETAAAWRAMEKAKARIEALTVRPAVGPYQPGYDPAKEQRDGVGVLPESAWGAEVDGLQAAGVGPARIRFNEKAPVKLVLRNVSTRIIRVTMERQSFALRISRVGGPMGASQSPPGRNVSHWKLQPGHQTVLPFLMIQLVAEGDPSPQAAISHFKPGTLSLQPAFGSGSGTWITKSKGREALVKRPLDEWHGWMEAGSFSMELLAEKVPLEIPAPPELPPGHGLQAKLAGGDAPAIQSLIQIELRPGLGLYLNMHQNEHWLMDSWSLDRNVFWGPITAERMREIGLMGLLEKETKAMIAQMHSGYAATRVCELVNGIAPFAAMGLRLAADPRIARDPKLSRSIRERRLELIKLGLEPEMRQAIAALTKHEPPVPPDSAFETVATTALPAGLDSVAWGPVDDGLCAAAVLPPTLAPGEVAQCRLLIRNASERQVYVTVSEAPGFDYATATDAAGVEVRARRPLVVPGGYMSRHRAEENPGESAQRPPAAVLKKLRLKPGAIYELTTPAGLAWHPPEDKSRPTWLTKTDPVTRLEGAAGVVTVTWHLHTTNGTEWSKDLKSRHWPARGGWSGVLRTAPQRVQLRDDAVRSQPDKARP